VKLLVSVRSVDEALAAAAHGADLIDMKEPAAGALGALPLPDIADIVRTLRARHPRLRLSATVGDLDAGGETALLERVGRTAACGVDDVKVGVAAGDARLLAGLAALAEAGLPQGARIVPVLLADDGVPAALVDACLACGFDAVMLDTHDKSRGSLAARRSEAELRGFVDALQAHGHHAGLAGSLRLEDLPALQATGCDFAGFRSAVCTGDRRGTLDAARVEALRRARDHHRDRQAVVLGA
jgi:uncharacterized protein (UPF0264 family)